MKSTTVYLTEDQIKALKDVAQKLEMSQSVIVRKGVDWAIDWARDRIEDLEKLDGATVEYGD